MDRQQLCAFKYDLGRDLMGEKDADEWPGKEMAF